MISEGDMLQLQYGVRHNVADHFQQISASVESYSDAQPQMAHLAVSRHKKRSRNAAANLGTHKYVQQLETGS
jgi:hypothetical protein